MKGPAAKFTENGQPLSEEGKCCRKYQRIILQGGKKDDISAYRTFGIPD